MEKKINKNKVKKYIASGLLTTSLIVSGVAISDACIDHVEHICPITKIINFVTGAKFNGDEVPVGYEMHQMPVMEKDLINEGCILPEVSYGECKYTDEQYARIYPDVYIGDDGKEHYSIPEYVFTENWEKGYDLGGKLYIQWKTKETVNNDGYGIIAESMEMFGGYLIDRTDYLTEDNYSRKLKY